jgi:hypothetical protein
MSSQLLNASASNGLRAGRLHSPRKSSQKKEPKAYTEDEVNDALEGALASGQDLVQTVRDLLEER